MNPQAQATRADFQRMFIGMQRIPEYGASMLKGFSDQLASYFVSSLTYVSMESPAFGISDSLSHMQEMFTNTVNKMAGVKSAATDFINYVTDSLLTYGLETVEEAVKEMLRDEIGPKVTQAASGVLGIVAVVVVGIFLAYQ